MTTSSYKTKDAFFHKIPIIHLQTKPTNNDTYMLQGNLQIQVEIKQSYSAQT